VKPPIDKRPWMKFQTSVWRSDAALRRCGFEAQGLWIGMLTLMHEASPYGHLVIAGVPATAADLADILGGKEKTIEKLLRILEERRVFSRTESGVIYSRKMIRDLQKAEEFQRHGRKGGNPTLNPHDKGPVNPTHNGEGKPPPYTKNQEIRIEKQEYSSVPSPDSRESDGPTSAIVHRIMPRLADPPGRWMLFTDPKYPLGEVDPDDPQLVRRPHVAGWYFDKACREICAAAGLDDPNWRGDWDTVARWLRDGLRVDDDILPAVSEAARHASGSIRSLYYFDREVRQRHRRRQQA
jgi:hypothetical protein